MHALTSEYIKTSHDKIKTNQMDLIKTRNKQKNANHIESLNNLFLLIVSVLECMGQTNNIIQKGRNKPVFIPTMRLCSKRLILLYHLGSEWNFYCILMLLISATYPGHIYLSIDMYMQPLYIYICTIQIVYTKYTHSRWKLEIL
jgi:hypothetical protein